MDKILKLFGFFSKRRKYQFIFLLCVMILTSLTEMIGIGLFYPILLLVSDPENFFKNKYLILISDYINIEDPKEFVLPFLFFSGIFISFTASLRVFAIWCYNKFAFGVGLDLGYKMYLNTKNLIDQAFNKIK